MVRERAGEPAVARAVTHRKMTPVRERRAAARTKAPGGAACGILPADHRARAAAEAAEWARAAVAARAEAKAAAVAEVVAEGKEGGADAGRRADERVYPETNCVEQRKEGKLCQQEIEEDQMVWDQ